MGLPYDVLANGTELEHAVFASVAKVHNRINETFFNRPENVPSVHRKSRRRMDPRPWCRGFYAAMNLNLRAWKPLLNRSDIHHGLLLPIFAYCVDEKISPYSASRVQVLTAHFFENEAYLDITLVVLAIKELYDPMRRAGYE